ncbi:uncharacterized protein LOC129290503 [Prosopis cineraria]|uniref:uncharacterized protein LOC129290503 n=1 Tax=Prosopis cineraria TaxID=364024 RepID=UPI002410671F|nr:uncharacterized protein LOC129290503 [Prosopis cineraria]XP_054783263.1 uncharacterized protein LOC129290503 [Prosopis cineraria]
MKLLHFVLVAVLAFQAMLFGSTLIEARPFLPPDKKYCSSCWWMGGHGGSRRAPPPPPSHSGGPTPKLQGGLTVTKLHPRPLPFSTTSHGPNPSSSYHIRGTTTAQYYPEAASA